MFDGLADQHPVKRVSMQRRKFVEVEDSLFIKRKYPDPMPFPLVNDETLNRTRQRQLPKRMLHGELPNGHCTQQHLVGRIRKDLLRCWRQLFRPGNDPQEGAGVEEALHPRVPSKASSMSSGKGSKKEGGTENRPFARPMGRG